MMLFCSDLQLFMGFIKIGMSASLIIKETRYLTKLWNHYEVEFDSNLEKPAMESMSELMMSAQSKLCMSVVIIVHNKEA